MIKIESQDQQEVYPQKMASVQGCGFYFTFPVPHDDVLCSMKISALLSRQKGRDFYDVMFLLPQTAPNYDFLLSQCGIANKAKLQRSLMKILDSVDLKHKSRDFEHLVFHKTGTKKIIYFKEFIKEWGES